MKPLSHTWSLAVEEQYYLLYPLFLLFVWHLGKCRTGAFAARSRLSLRSKQNCVRWAGLAFCLLLSACNKQEGPAMLEDYASRMSNVLEVDIQLELSAAAQQVPALPSMRDRLLPTVELREGVIDVWDFRQCGMISIIAERNSSLGKVMLPSQKMTYEIWFFQALQDCRARVYAVIARDQAQQAFIERLENIYIIKRQNLSAELWNGIYTSDEISAQFIIKQKTLALKEEVGSVQRALEKFLALAKLSEQEIIITPAWLEDIEDYYFAMHSNHFGARLLATLPMVTRTLDKTAEAINIRLAQKPFCPAGHQPPRANILLNVFQRYYVDRILPYMAMIQRDGKPWLQRHDEIMTLLPAPAAMQLYHQQVVSLSDDDGLWQRWQRAIRRHTKAWQAILGQCGMMPKRRPLT